MAGFVKLHSSILRSTIWFARPDRDVFLTALLVAEPIETTEPLEQLEARSLTATGWVIPPGRYGFCEASGAGIIRLAGVELDQGFEALERLSSPEPESRSASFGGRRLARVDGGWIVLNLFKYRDKDGTAPERSRRYRAKKKSRSSSNESRLDRDVTRDITHAEAEAEAEAEERDLPLPPPGEVQCELRLETVPSECEHRLALSLPLEQSRMRQNERNEGGELPEGTPTPKTRQRCSHTAKREKEPKPPKPVETDPPDDFAPNEATLAAATDSGRDWRSDWVECRDWHLANGKRKVDWQATLRGWMRRNFGKAPAQPRVDQRPPPPTNDPWWHWETTRGAPHWREVEILKRNELERRERAKETA